MCQLVLINGELFDSADGGEMKRDMILRCEHRSLFALDLQNKNEENMNKF